MKRLLLLSVVFLLLTCPVIAFANEDNEGTALGATYDFNYPTFFLAFRKYPIVFELHFSGSSYTETYPPVTWSISEHTVSPYLLFFLSREFPKPFIGCGYESYSYLDKIKLPDYSDLFEISGTTFLVFAGVEIGQKLYISPRLFLKFNEYRSPNLPDWNRQTVELSPKIAIYYCF